MNPKHAENLAGSRPLTMNDLSAAFELGKDKRVLLMRAILADLRSVESISGCDDAGIPRRATPIFAEIVDGRSLRELATAYIELRQMGAQMAVIDALETARGVIDTPSAAAD